MRHPYLALVCTAVATFAASNPSQAQDAVSTTERVVVKGEEVVEKTELSGSPAAAPASVSVLKYTEDQKRNLRDYTDLIRNVAGVAANSFDQGGVGYGFALRGFGERSNGGNVAYSIDGVPINFPGHPASNGYGDLFPLIPELVDSLVLVRGPFDVRFGAFDLGGSLQITTLDRPPGGLSLSIGNFDYYRGLLVYGLGAGQVSGYGSLVASTLNGYRDNQEFRQINTFDKILFPMLGGTGSFRLQVYNSDYGSPGYLNRTLLRSGVLKPTQAVNITDGGSTAQQTLAFNYKQDGDQPIVGTAYFVHEDFKRWSTRTFTVPISPNRAGQALQGDYRFVLGGSLEKYTKWDLAHDMGIGLLLGGGIRYDTVDSEQFNTIRRNPVRLANGRLSVTSDVNFDELNPFGYMQLDFKPASWVKMTGGFRYDHFFYEIEDNFRHLMTEPDDGFLSPRAGVSIAPVKGLDFFGNYGKGFRPPSAITEFNLDPKLESAENETAEVGLQYNSPGGMFHFLFDAYRTTFTNELQGRPNPQPPIALGPSERNGVDLEARLRLWNDRGRSFSLLGNFSSLTRELVNRPTGTYIPDVADYFGNYGFDVVMPLPEATSPHVITFSAMQRWEGPKPLNTTNSLSTKSYSRVDVRLAYTNANWRGFSTFLNLIFYPDRRYEETAFLFAPTVGVSPKAPITVQGGVFIPL
ncbi:MAG: TonB-dependent receptor plug domain-containing protein [Verrucomicrobiota bacterium]|nr:TonB-dependent receptor plug domain-containing protein [Verrucomicrobiota bacterium]